MRKYWRIGGMVFGTVGLLLCVAAILLGWCAAAKSVDRIDRAATRLDGGLSEADVRLARVESRVSTVRAELSEVRRGAEALVTDNPELPRVKAEIERLLDRLLPALDRVDATADSLRSVVVALRSVADLVNQLNGDSDAPVRLGRAANAIDRAADLLNAPRAKIDAVKSAQAVQLIRRLVTLAREAVAASDLLAEGLATAREEIIIAKTQAVEYQNKLVFWVFAAAAANTLFWLWGGLGQLCLVGWGRRRSE